MTDVKISKRRYLHNTSVGPHEIFIAHQGKSNTFLRVENFTVVDTSLNQTISQYYQEWLRVTSRAPHCDARAAHQACGTPSGPANLNLIMRKCQANPE